MGRNKCRKVSLKYKIALGTWGPGWVIYLGGTAVVSQLLYFVTVCNMLAPLIIHLHFFLLLGALFCSSEIPGLHSIFCNPFYSMLHLSSCSQRTEVHVELTCVLPFSLRLCSCIGCWPVPRNSCCICFIQFCPCLWWEGKSVTSYSVKEVEVVYSFETDTICVFCHWYQSPGHLYYKLLAYRLSLHLKSCHHSR